ncbi:MAG: hypothetical protein JNN17_13125 [Verrucomicrobiaceae bacterium]|nr:hypothetical protein [Verrucomicrobiaceae bacterium]
MNLPAPMLASFADAFGLMEPFYEDLQVVCADIFDILQLFTFTFAFLGLLISTYKGMMSGSFEGAFTTILYTGLACTIMPFFPEWLIEDVRVALSDDLLEALEVDPLSLMETFGGSFEDLDINTDASALLGLFVDPLAIIDYIANIIAAFCMILIGLFCYFIFFFAYQVQIMALYVGAAASPIFFGMFLFEQKRDIAIKYFTGLLAITMWPLGWGIGLLLTDFLLQVGIDIVMLLTATLLLNPLWGVVIRDIAIFCLVIAAATWIMFVIFKAPGIIHKAVVNGTQIGLGFTGQAVNSAMAGVGAGVSVASSVAGMVPGGSGVSSAISGAGGAVTGVGSSIGGMTSGLERED